MKMKTPGETNLEKLIQSMSPQLNPGEYVYLTLVDIGSIPREVSVCEIREREGTTLIIEKNKADQLGLDYGFVCSWITLEIHSSLEAVGLTAAFSSALAKHGISCNVVAGYYHDHIFVNQNHEQAALKVLRELSEKVN